MTFVIHTKKIRRQAEDAALGAAEAARAGAELVGRGAEGILARLRLEKEVRSLQEEIDLQMRTIGELAYAAHQGEDGRGTEELLAYVDSLHGELDGCRRQLDAMRGALICSVCGASNNSANLYCANCGHALGTC